ncbi:stomatal closure-related actin-binding 3-like [Olea europaea subsp. europaea]|uniref:Stomatal closure-related actin-binding 3-like n=1 Tax=Olea europaea subsp. europaea TaxID=158383 RepID=A0A8S0U7M9_OLEEU|nr:stomatal closure-related actin-binding 3-like [Olea europaea subsp. europaea]
MTRVSPEFGDQEQVYLPVSNDVSFSSNQFPKYKLGPDNEILDEVKEDFKGPFLKEVVVEETNQLTEQHKRLSVRDLASKFDKNLSAAAKLSEEAKLREVPSLEGHVLLKKLRDALECLKGRLAGQNKEDVEKAISMVEALAVKLTQKEGELIQEKFEVKKLANFLKQASEDAKKLVNQEKSYACAEIESARAVVQRIGEALDEQERTSQTSGKQETEELIEEVQEARRIKLLHQPLKVMDMEHELRELRIQIREKCKISFDIRKELAMSKREENKSQFYELSGSESLGSILRIQPSSDEATDLSKCLIQWYRLSSECSRREAILGANKFIYAPEPIDVGRVLQADIISNGQKESVITNGPIDKAAELDSYVEALFRKSNYEFSVFISQMNGRNYSSHSAHLFQVGKTRMKLSRGWITKARDSYSKSMQFCGFRGGGNSAAKSLFWQARKGQSFVLVFESERERNGALILARKYALDCNVLLAGPDDDALL